MAEPSGGAERDPGDKGVGGGVGSGPSSGEGSNFVGFGGQPVGLGSAKGFGVTDPQHEDTEMAGMRPGFVDLRGLTLDGIKSLIENGWSIDKSGQFGFSPEMAGNVRAANYGQGLLMSGMVGQAFPGLAGLGFKGATALADLMGRAGRSLGMTGTAQGFKGGTGDPGDSPSNTAPAPSSLALTPTALPPSGNPLLNISQAAQQARPGWLNPYLGNYSSPQPAGPATNQGLPSGQRGPLYA